MWEGVFELVQHTIEHTNTQNPHARTHIDNSAQFENLDLQTSVVEGVMSQQAAVSTPEHEVAALMQQVGT